MRILCLNSQHPPCPKRKGGFHFGRFSGFKFSPAILLVILASLYYTGCGYPLNTQEKSIVVATTTSLYDSGALDRVVPAFERLHSVRVKLIPAGSGEALRLGAMGEADLVITHAPREEEEFIRKGYGLRRVPFLKTEYVLAGPEDDPASAAMAFSLEEALRRIGNKGFLFVSRGDNSGTHILELDLWRAAGIKPGGKRWYIETGQGMGETLSIANEKGAYCLTDLCAYLSHPHLEALSIILSPDPPLECVYAAIVVNTAKNWKLDGNMRHAKRFADFLSSPKCRELISGFKVKGKTLYMPYR